MEILHTLEKQHKEVARLFEKFHKASADEDKERILGTLINNLNAHLESEEEAFYPVARRYDEKSYEVDQREHGEIRAALLPVEAALMRRNFDQHNLEAMVANLKSTVVDHVNEEERELFPILRQAMTASEREELNKRYVKVFERHMTQISIPYLHARSTPLSTLREPSRGAVM